MAESSKAWWPLADRGEEFKTLIEQRSGAIAEEVVTAVAAETPELVGPDPRLRELFSLVVQANLENFAAAIAYKIPAEAGFEPPTAVEHARLLAQRGVTANSMLLGYQVILRSLIGPVIEAVKGFAEDPDDLVRTIDAVLALLLIQASGASQAALRTHSVAHDAWMRGRGAGLSKRLDAVLDRAITDASAAERALNYSISGNHVAFIASLDDPNRPLELADAEKRVAGLPGVRDALLVPRDERTLYGWLHAPDSAHMNEWMESARETPESRIAFGELAEGLDGFRLSHLQAKSALGVIVASPSRPSTMVVRYRDVAVLSFLVERPTESRDWAQQVLGDLMGPADDLRTLRETLSVFLEEGENAIAAAQKLFVHRNTVKYRVDRASSLLPQPLEVRRLDVTLALRYVDWVGI